MSILLQVTETGEVMVVETGTGTGTETETGTETVERTGQKQDEGGGMKNYTSIFFMVAIFAVFYLLLIRPQQKRQKEIRKFREALSVGSKVVTAGGIYGKIKEINDATILLEIAENVRIKVDKSSVFASSEDVQQQQK